MRAPVPDTEHERLAALADYDIVDTPTEKDFDDIVALASAICDCRVALVSLVTEDRQWFKAAAGTDLNDSTRDNAICGHALLQSDILEIEDTATDPRTSDNTLIVHENIFGSMPVPSCAHRPVWPSGRCACWTTNRAG